MPDLKTRYLGLTLNNPIIVSSCGITGSREGVKRCAEAGAGAVVLKSLFEELIVAESEILDRELLASEHPEALEYLRADLGMRMGPRPYLAFIEAVKKDVDIPVIASVHCTSSKWWVSYAKNIENAGADALELNISHYPDSETSPPGNVEKRYADIVRTVAGSVSIPVAAKVGHYFTSLAVFLESLARAGARGLVLFNRYYNSDIDLARKTIVPAITMSGNEEMFVPLRWTGIMSKRLKNCDIAASSGIHNVKGIVKMIMAGASATQICSILYRHGPEYVGLLAGQLNSWLADNGFDAVSDIKGLAVSGGREADMLKRIQYIQALDAASKYEY